MANSTADFPKPRALPIVIGLTAILLLFLGIVLSLAGGSLYYVISGFALAACSFLLFKGDPRGSWVYGIFLIITYLWSFYEVGLDAWSLMPRVAMFSVLGFWFLVPRVRKGLLQEQPEPFTSKIETRYTTILIAVLLIVIYINNTSYDVQVPSSPGTGLVNNESGQWSHYGATKKGTRYAPSDQINLENVHLLERAWETRTGVPGTFKGTPIQVGDGLYLFTGQNIILSLDKT